MPDHFVGGGAFVEYAIRPTLLHPKSRGTVRLRSSGLAAKVRISYNFFSDPGDLPALREGFKRAREVGRQSALDLYREREVAPGEAALSAAEIDAYIRKVSLTTHHPAGTCRMRTDMQAVCDPELKVRGVRHLRVCDASAMPDLVSAHINACVLMMGEKAADMIHGRTLAPQESNAPSAAVE